VKIKALQIKCNESLSNKSRLEELDHRSARIMFECYLRIEKREKAVELLESAATGLQAHDPTQLEFCNLILKYFSQDRLESLFEM
jgi:hypothetical protein